MVDSTATLSVGSGSKSAGVGAAAAAFSREPARSGRTTRTTVAVLPLGMIPRSHVTTSATSEQLPWLAVAETKSSVRASASTTWTPGAAAGPSFLTVIV